MQSANTLDILLYYILLYYILLHSTTFFYILLLDFDKEEPFLHCTAAGLFLDTWKRPWEALDRRGAEQRRASGAWFGYSEFLWIPMNSYDIDDDNDPIHDQIFQQKDRLVSQGCLTPWGKWQPDQPLRRDEKSSQFCTLHKRERGFTELTGPPFFAMIDTSEDTDAGWNAFDDCCVARTAFSYTQFRTVQLLCVIPPETVQFPVRLGYVWTAKWTVSAARSGELYVCIGGGPAATASAGFVIGFVGLFRLHEIAQKNTRSFWEHCFCLEVPPAF